MLEDKPVSTRITETTPDTSSQLHANLWNSLALTEAWAARPVGEPGEPRGRLPRQSRAGGRSSQSAKTRSSSHSTGWAITVA